MYNSTIKRTPLVKKKCKCDTCQADPVHAKWPTLGCQGFFYDHLPDNLKEKALTKRAVQNKNRNAKLAAQSKLRRENIVNKPDNDLELYYRLGSQLLSKLRRCDNCMEPISENDYRNATAHILAKADFHSVRANPNNMLFLCVRENGCHQKTHRWDTFQKMRIWNLAVQKFKEIYPFIAKEERGRIPDCLWATIPDEYQKRYGSALVVDMKEDLPFKK